MTDPLALVDHSAIEYDEFAKDFYSDAPAIAAMSEAEVRASFKAARIEGTTAGLR